MAISGDRSRQRLRRLFVVAAAMAALTVQIPAQATAPGSGSAAAPAAAAGKKTPHPSHRVCAHPADPSHAACSALERDDVEQSKAQVAASADAAPSGLGPADLQAAYQLPSSTGGAGQTVAIVDAYDDPSAETELATYRQQYGLPACTTANGCFTKIDHTTRSRRSIRPSARSTRPWTTRLCARRTSASGRTNRRPSTW
nr:hypothetical protein OH826_16360 [Streptomyces sp. NBC_00899]